MTATKAIADLVTTVTESVANENVSAEESLSKLKTVVFDSIDFSNVTALWQLSKISADVLAVLLPEKAKVFVSQGDRTGPAGASRIEPETGVLIVIRLVLRGLELCDTNDLRRQGASKLLANCPKPIKTSATPFADTSGLWEHTRVRSSKPN